MIVLFTTLLASAECPPLLDARSALERRDFRALLQWKVEAEDMGCGQSIRAASWLLELARFARCLPVQGTSANARVLRLHESMLALSRVASDYEGTELEDLRKLLIAKPKDEAPVSDRLSWPVESERWPGEGPEAFVAPSACNDPLDRSAERASALRVEIASERLALIRDPRDLLPESLGLLAYQALSQLDAARTSTSSLQAIERALHYAPNDARATGALILAELHRRRGDQTRELLALDDVLTNPARRVDQELRAASILAARLVEESPPRWGSILELGLGPSGRVPQESVDDLLFLLAQRSRALNREPDASAESWQELVERAAPIMNGSASAEAIIDSLVSRASRLSANEAVRWIESSKIAGLDLGVLASRALRMGAAELARAAIQRLESLDKSSKSLSLQAELAVLMDDAVALQNIVAEMAQSERRGVRLIRETCLSLAARIASSQKAKLFAGALIDAEKKLSASRQCASLLSVTPTSDRPIRHLGEVVVMRMGKLPEPPRPPLVKAPMRIAMAFQDEGGVWRVGSPWELEPSSFHTPP
ncbi:MAG: hypothetical protein HY791_12485 [Deltaproteobacteria bacterium]|nr:hypothetical protein [Deltaproteobacteria bacterium]